MKSTTYYVWDGVRSPTIPHKHRDSAETEATRLARKHPDTAFFVVALVSRVTVTDVQIERVEDNAFPWNMTPTH